MPYVVKATAVLENYPLKVYSDYDRHSSFVIYPLPKLADQDHPLMHLSLLPEAREACQPLN
jgi:hypothetical protein